MPTDGPQAFWVDGHALTDLAAPAAQALLTGVWRRGERVGCGCRVPPIPMYVAAVGRRYLVKRMPGTGQDHHRDCRSYEPYVSAFDGVDDTDPDRIVLRLALATDCRGPGRRPPRRSRGGTGPVGRLDLAGLLAYLWQEAGLDAWSPKMEGKRHWGVVSWHLREAAHGKTIGTGPLSEQLYVPPPFHSDRRSELAGDRHAAWQHAQRHERLLIVIGEAKAIEAATYGHRLRLKHLPDAPIYLDDQGCTQLFREHLAAVELIGDDTAGHPMAIAAVRVTAKGHARAREVALLKTTPEWLPYRAGLERRILAEAVEQGRRFIATSCRPAATVGGAPSLVLTDTREPVAVLTAVPSAAASGGGQWTWEPGKPWPAVQTAPCAKNPKEQITHG